MATALERNSQLYVYGNRCLSGRSHIDPSLRGRQQQQFLSLKHMVESSSNTKLKLNFGDFLYTNATPRQPSLINGRRTRSQRHAGRTETPKENFVPLHRLYFRKTPLRDSIWAIKIVRPQTFSGRNKSIFLTYKSLHKVLLSSLPPFFFTRIPPSAPRGTSRRPGSGRCQSL